MTRLRILSLAGCSLLISALLLPRDGHAYTISNYCFTGGEPRWTSGTQSVLEVCNNGSNYTSIVGAGDSGAYSNTHSAMLDAYWMWVREYTSSSRLAVDQSSCATWEANGAWMDPPAKVNGPGSVSETWYESQAIITDACGSALGCTALRYRCLLEDRIYSADIMMNQQGAWNTVFQNTLNECLSTGLTWSLTMLHEVGHAYGLGHEEGYMNMMRSSSGGVRPRNCHVGQGYRPFPFPDDMNGLMNRYRNYDPANPPRNFSGTPFYLSGGAGVLANTTVTVSSSGTPVTVPWTWESFYPIIGTTTSMDFRVVLIPTTEAPTFSYTTNVWTFPASARFRTLRFITATDPNLDELGFSAFNSFYETIASGELVAGIVYRVWLQLDPYREKAETDEGDNVFPTGIRVQR